jgi:hypothetical protein
MIDDFHFVFGTMNLKADLVLQMEQGEKKAEVHIYE